MATDSIDQSEPSPFGEEAGLLIDFAHSGGRISRLPNIFESIEYAPGPSTKSAIITSVWRQNSNDLGPSHTGQQIASKTIENTLAIGVNAPQRRRRLISARAKVFHRGMSPIAEFWTVESNSIPMTEARSKNRAAPGKPAGNIENSRCTDSS